MTSTGQPNSIDKLDILIDQVGHFTEGLTELKLLIQQQAETAQKQLEAIDKQSAAIDKQSEKIDKQSQAIDKQSKMIEQLAISSERQWQSIDRLANSVEATNHSQSEAIIRLVSVVDKLIQRTA